MDEQLDDPNTGRTNEADLADTCHDSEDDTPPEIPQSRGRRKILSGIFECQECNNVYQSQPNSPDAMESSQHFTLYQNDGLNGSENEPEFEGHIHIEDDQNLRTTKPTLSKTNTTFDAPTKSSMAKQNEKVEIPHTIRRTSTCNRALPSRGDARRRQLSQSDEDHDGAPRIGNFPFVTSRPDDWRRPGDQQGASVQRASPLGPDAERLGHRSQNTQPEPSRPEYAGHQSSDRLNSPYYGTGSEDYSQDSPRPNALPSDQRKNIPYEDRAHDKRPLGSSATSPSVAFFDEDHIVVAKEQFKDLRNKRDDLEKDLQATRNECNVLRGELYQAQNERDNLRRSTQAAQDRHKLLEDNLRASQEEHNKSVENLRVALEDLRQLQQERTIVDADMKALTQRIDTCYLQGNVPNTLEEAVTELRLLRTAGLDAKQAEKDADDADKAAKQIYDDLEHLTQDLQFLGICINDKSTAVLVGATAADQIKVKMQGGTSAAAARDHATSLLLLFDAFDATFERLTEANSQLRQELTVEQRLSKYLDEKKKGTNSESSLTFKTLYEELVKKYRILEAKLQEAQGLAAEAKNHKLETENAKLKDNLVEYHQKATFPKMQASVHQANARRWQDEVKIVKEELEKRTSAFQEASDDQVKETRMYIEEYHNKTRDESHWNLQELQSKLAKLESELSKTDILFNKTKVDNARLEREVEQLQADDKKKDDYMKSLMYAGEIPTLDQDDATSESSDPSSPRAWLETPDFTKRVPCYSPQFIVRQEKCKADMVDFRKDQERRRLEEDNALDEMMERLRKYRMEVMDVKYPPGKGTDWGTVKKESSWDRWGGEAWRREVKLAPQDERLIKGLKEKNALTTEEKPW
ncbi:hypothetical protein NX059_006828 [Plenodomus lindquistii]|nr:hypothetical protein NX059_006828 [Plenodomus lindquistii]